MNKLTLSAITALSFVLAACQQTKLQSTPTPQPAQAQPTPGPGPIVPPPVPMPPRFPEREPIDPVVMVPPPPMPQLPPQGPPPVPVLPPPPVQPVRPTENEPRDPGPVRPTPPVTSNPPISTPTTPPVLTPVDRQTPQPQPTRPTPPQVNTQPQPVQPTPVTPQPQPQTPVAQPTPVTPVPQQPVVPPPQKVVDPYPNHPLPPPRPTDIAQPAPQPKPEPQPKPQPPPPPVYEPVDGQCHVEPFTIPPKEKTTKLDILFVVDTSGSIRKGPNNDNVGGELEKMASEMDNFVQMLKPDTDYNIGVMLAHGPKSPYFARLFSDDGVAVIKSAQYKKDRTQMWKILRNKMLKVKDDTWDPHQGEASLLNIYASIAGLNRLAAIKDAGLFRDDANVAIIIVTDENDVCHQYPKELSSYTQADKEAFARGDAPVLKEYPAGGKNKGKILSADRLEIQAQKLCMLKGKDGKDRPINAETVVQKLQQLQEYKGKDGKGNSIKGEVFVNGIIYNDNSKLSAVTNNEDENEMAHGVIELIQATGGTAADLHEVRENKTFSNALKLVGKMTEFRSNQKSVNITCRSGLVDGKGFHANAIDPSTVEMAIIEANANEIDYYNDQRPNIGDFGTVLAKYSARCPDRGACQHANGGLKVQSVEGNTIRVTPTDPSTLTRVFDERGIVTAKYKITFKTKKGINPQTGETAAQVAKRPQQTQTAQTQQPPAAQPPEVKAAAAAQSKGAAQTQAQKPANAANAQTPAQKPTSATQPQQSQPRPRVADIAPRKVTPGALPPPGSRKN